MSNISSMITYLKPNSLESNQRLAESITRSASRQTYYTIRLLADRDRVAEAYHTYAYFRWVDDQLDEGGMNKSERLQFIEHQKRLIEHCYRGQWPRHVSEEESMLMKLIRFGSSKDARAMDYALPPVAAQLDEGARDLDRKISLLHFAAHGTLG